jgi:hypothetical protein
LSLHELDPGSRQRPQALYCEDSLEDPTSLEGVKIMPVVVRIDAAVLLRKLLEEQLTRIRKGTVREKPLREAVEGLEALMYGEVQDIFAPKKKTTHDGTKPYTLRKLRMRALGFIDLLIAKKHKAVIRKVAEAFGENADTVRGWRKSKVLGKTRDLLMQSFRKEISKKMDCDEQRILVKLDKTGAEYRRQEKLAFKSKKGK